MIKNSVKQDLFILIILFASAVLPMSCGKQKGNDIEIKRLDRVLEQYKDMDSTARAALRDSLALELTALMRILEVDTAATDEALMLWSESMPVTMFTPAAEAVFPVTDSLSHAVTTALSVASREGLDLPQYKYAAVVWGREKSIIVYDSVMFIALNHYLGQDHEAYDHWPEYMRVLKRPDMLPYDIIESELALKYPYTPQAGDETVLSHLLYDGAISYIKMQLMENANECNALGFTADQLEDIRKNESFIWQRLAAGKMLYSTDSDILSKLLDPAPRSSLISADAPGRAVRYTGYRIVCQYMDRYPDTRLADLLSPQFYNSRQTLQKAAYAPDKNK
ncbi:MAG: hypothetical protein Q4F07_05945 [Bacteroidales bacterium]|nr:hypothetical protein [Bacteroidales bacterium]